MVDSQRIQEIGFKQKLKIAYSGFNSAELLTIFYSIITGIMILFFWDKIDHAYSLLIKRVMIIIGLFFISYFSAQKITNRQGFAIINFGRATLMFILLSGWYSETFEFNSNFQNLDHIFAAFEQKLFNFQPADIFSLKYSSRRASELFYFGYFSYFPLIFVCMFICFVKGSRIDFDRLLFVLFGSFFIFYLIFIVLPVCGPQFYYPIIGEECVTKGIFPKIGFFFNENEYEKITPVIGEGTFRRLVTLSQSMGERPTASFPSSHVGICMLLVCWSFKNFRKLFYFTLPIFIILSASTIYIRAHYLIDVFAGWICGFLFFLILNKGFNQFKEKKLKNGSSHPFSQDFQFN